MTRIWHCDADNCDLVMEHPFIAVQYWATDEEDDDDDDNDVLEESHFCSWVCHAAWAVNQAMTAET